MSRTDEPRSDEQYSASSPLEPDNPARRRWLTGMLAGPAVVSLPNMASAAMGSIATCVENYTGKLSIPLHVSYAELDQYARERVPGVCAYKGREGTNGYREQMLVRTGYGELVDPQYNKWVEDGNKIVDPWGEGWKYDSTLVAPDRYRLKFGVVDEFGEFVTDNYELANAVPLSRSCYASIAVIM